MNNLPNNTESKIRKILFNEAALFFGLVGTILGGFVYITNPQHRNDIAIELLRQQSDQNRKTIEGLIDNQKNDLHTLQKTIDDMKAEQQALRESVVELRTIIEERIPKKTKP